MRNSEIAITGISMVSSLGESGNKVAAKLLRGDTGVRKFAFQPGTRQFVGARFRAGLKTATPDRWPISRPTALALKASQIILPVNGTPLPPQPRFGLIHATAYGNLQSLLSYQSDLRRFGLRRASPMQFPNTILHAAACFLSIRTGAAAFNITLSNQNLSGLDALETAAELIKLGCADRVLVVTSEDISTELIPILESSDELDWRGPDPFGQKRSGYVLGEAAAAILLETVGQAKKCGSRIYAILRGSSGVVHGEHDQHICERTMRSALATAQLAPEDVGCVFASANGSSTDGEEANSIAAVFGNNTPVTTVAGAFGECGASSSLLSIASAIYCCQRGHYPPTVGRSHYDRRLRPIRLLRQKMRMSGSVFLVNAFNRAAKSSQIWQLISEKGSA